jgi:signal transduction histidine kinase
MVFSSILNFDLQFLRNVLITNLKHRYSSIVLFLDELPYGVSFAPTIKRLIEKYLNAFHKLQDLSEKDEHFDSVITLLSTFNAKDPIEVAVGINEWRFEMKNRYCLEDEFPAYSSKIDDQLNKFYNKRTSARLMVQNYFSIRETGKSVTEKNIDLKIIIDEAYQMARILCMDKYGMCPKLVMSGGIDSFNYVTPHLLTILLEIIKNSLEATVLKQQRTPEMSNQELPSIHVLISQFEQKVVIRVHDDGIGIAPNDMVKVWSYFYSTSADSIHRMENIQTLLLDSEKIHNTTMISGFGYGLPLTQTLLQFFGGHVTINSVKNNCTDVYLYFGT